MDINKLDLKAQKNIAMPAELEMNEQCFYIASRGIYSQYRSGEISLVQAKKEKAQIIKMYRYGHGNIIEVEKPVEFNKQYVIESVILELGRYISCANTNQDREKTYPRKLFEKRIVEVIDKAYG